MTSEREKLIDFSHSFNETYTAIAVRETTLWSAVTGFLTSPKLLKAVLIVLGIAILVGAIFFLLEHRINKKLFSNDSVLGRILETTIIGLMFVTNGPIRFYRFKTLTARTLSASTSSAFLTDNGIIHQTRPDLDTLVMALDAGKLDAIVSDAAFLSYRINQGKQQGHFKSLTVLPYELEAQNYAFILAEDSPLREGINRTLLSVRMQRDWREKIEQYLGE